VATDAPTFVAGLRSTGSDFLGPDERPKNFREAILWLDPNGMTPLTALSAKMKSETTDDPEINWWEETLDASRGVLDGAALPANGGGGATETFTLLAGSEASGVRAVSPAFQFVPGDLLQIYDTNLPQADDYTTHEIIKVVLVTGALVFTAVRGYAGTEIAVQANDRVLLIGKAFGEGTAGASTRTSRPVKHTNYTQIFKTSFELTNTARQTNYRTGDAFQNDRKRAMFNHSEALEQAMFWGLSSEVAGTITGSNPERTMGGLREFLTSHRDGTFGAITEDFFLDTITPLFDFNAGGAGDQRVCFIGNGALNKFQKVARGSVGALTSSRINYEGKLTFLGLKLLEYMIPQGSLFLKSHPLMNTDPIYTNSMFVINPKGIIIRPLRGRDTKIQKEIQNNDMDTRKDQWLTETTMELQYERTMGYFGGMT